MPKEFLEPFKQIDFSFILDRFPIVKVEKVFKFIYVSDIKNCSHTIGCRWFVDIIFSHFIPFCD